LLIGIISLTSGSPSVHQYSSLSRSDGILESNNGPVYWNYSMRQGHYLTVALTMTVYSLTCDSGSKKA
jgi:hypothetical protein